MVTKERITPETRASAIYEWIVQQIALTEGELHPEQIIKHIANQIGQAESLANVPKHSRVPTGERVTTLTKATDAVKNVIDEIVYLGVTPKSYMPVEMAMRTLKANNVVDAMTASVHSLLIEFIDTYIATLEPLLNCGAPRVYDSYGMAVCYYCRVELTLNEQGASVCLNNECQWAILYKRIKGK